MLIHGNWSNGATVASSATNRNYLGRRATYPPGYNASSNASIGSVGVVQSLGIRTHPSSTYMVCDKTATPFQLLGFKSSGAVLGLASNEIWVKDICTDIFELPSDVQLSGSGGDADDLAVWKNTFFIGASKAPGGLASGSDYGQIAMVEASSGKTLRIIECPDRPHSVDFGQRIVVNEGILLARGYVTSSSPYYSSSGDNYQVYGFDALSGEFLGRYNHRNMGSGGICESNTGGMGWGSNFDGMAVVDGKVYIADRYDSYIPGERGPNAEIGQPSNGTYLAGIGRIYVYTPSGNFLHTIDNPYPTTNAYMGASWGSIHGMYGADGYLVVNVGSYNVRGSSISKRSFIVFNTRTGEVSSWPEAPLYSSGINLDDISAKGIGSNLILTDSGLAQTYIRLFELDGSTSGNAIDINAISGANSGYSNNVGPGSRDATFGYLPQNGTGIPNTESFFICTYGIIGSGSGSGAANNYIVLPINTGKDPRNY